MQENINKTSNAVNELYARSNQLIRHGVPMTAAELLTNLGEIRDSFEWHVTSRGRIRGSLKSARDGRVFDPITAVAYFQTGQYVPEGSWSLAADRLGMECSDCADIVAACNYSWDPSCRQGMLRREFMNMVLPETIHAIAGSAGMTLADPAGVFPKRNATTH